MDKSRSKQLGFTIVELLVVIVVIGILAAVTIVSYTGINQRAIVVSIQSDLASAAKQLKLFNVDNRGYPIANNCSNTQSSEICLKPTSGNLFRFYSYSNSGSQTFYIQSKNGNVCYGINQSSQPYIEDCNWIAGRSGSALEGKFVYSQDEASTLQWKSENTSCVSLPQCSNTGLDPSYPTVWTIVADNSVDFSLYPARNACKTRGGRLPYMNELGEIYGNKAVYGDNYQAAYYWASSQYVSADPYMLHLGNGTVNWTWRMLTQRVRCVK